jgi:serine/threonine-protein kinase
MMTDAIANGVRPGDVLAGKYRVERVLGAGGMGVVVAARHLALDERVALKFLLPETLKNAEAVARFDREARAAVKIKSEHVARIIDVGRLETGAPYIVMECLEGGDLAAWVKQHGALPVEQAVEFVLHACEAIAEAHALGIIHRDLKPANLFYVRRADGLLSVKVLDFGISKVTADSKANASMTRTSAIVGSPMYMSPEQLRSSKGVDARTDVWSLGVILFELLTGRPPFVAEAVTEVVIKIAVEPAPAVRLFRTDVQPGLEQAVFRCLEKDRERRFQNVGDLCKALCDFAPARARPSVERILRTLQAAGISSAPPPAAPSPVVMQSPASSSSNSGRVTGTVPLTSASWGNTAAESRTRRTVIGVTAGAAGAAVVGIGVAVLFALWHPGETQAAGASTVTSNAPPPASAAASALETVAPVPAAASVEPAGAALDASGPAVAALDASAPAAAAVPVERSAPPATIPSRSFSGPGSRSSSPASSSSAKAHVYDHM